ncbi:MAG: LemA family protein [Verrucomicrobia bacterium]|nr:LemA family protein [Verrucomicrobiota bacterium]
MQTEIVWPAWIIAGVLTLYLFWLMLYAGRRLRFLADTPTSKAKGVFIGQVELAGTAKLEPPRRSFLAEVDCVWFSYTIHEEWERLVTETYTDKDGKTKTRQVLKSGWTEVGSGGEAPAFYVEDDTGAVLVQPDGAEIEAPTVFSETVTRGDALYFQKCSHSGIADSTGRRRFQEQAIPLKAELFVTGYARERPDVVAPEIAADSAQELYLISCNGEARVQRSYRKKFWFSGLAMLVGLPVASLIQLNNTHQPITPILPVSLAAVLLIAWLTGWLWMAFNSLVHLRNRTAQGWSLIDVQLKRRAELIPRLVEVVKGLRDHERVVQTEVAALRTQAVATAPGQPGPDIDSARPLIVAIAERYPELKSSDAFLNLQRELSDTETRIALARDYYNSIATHLNTRLEIIPDCWFAPLASLRPCPLLTVESFERAAVNVNLHTV